MTKIFTIIFLFAAFVNAQESTAGNVEYIPPAKYAKLVDALTDAGIPFPKASDIVSLSYDKFAQEFSIVVNEQSTGGQKTIKVGYINKKFDEQMSRINQPIGIFKETVVDESELKKQNGRVYFMGNTTLKSLWLYPNAINTIGENVDDQVIAGMVLLTGGATLYGTYLFTKNRELGYGRVAMMNYGSELLGFHYPQLLSVFLHNSTNVDDDDENWRYDSYGYSYYEPKAKTSEKAAAWASAVGFPLGIYIGSKVNFTGNHDYGNAAVMATFSRWAYLYGYLLPSFYENSLTEEEYFGTASVLTMTLLPVGYYAGYKFIDGKEISAGRSFMIASGGVMGTATGALLPTLFEVDEYRVYTSAALLGNIAGTLFGYKFNMKHNYTFGQGVFMSLSAAAGAAVALSVPLIMQADNHQAYTLAGLGGGWSGYFLGENLARSIFDSSERDKKESASNISFPIAYEWPLILGANLAEKKTGNMLKTPVVDIIRINL
ncbi:MAG: hypothetical protein JNL74_03390 [Fibrobacteres bacterium]|nr:hypothetical protein [Fibrobacterota bacterium]